MENSREFGNHICRKTIQNPNTHTSHDFEKRSFIRSHLREAQEKTLQLPETGMVVSIDLGDPYDVHPKNKQEFGKRLALQALQKVYKKDIIADGPFYDYHSSNGSDFDRKKVRVGEGRRQSKYSISPQLVKAGGFTSCVFVQP